MQATPPSITTSCQSSAVIEQTRRDAINWMSAKTQNASEVRTHTEIHHILPKTVEICSSLFLNLLSLYVHLELCIMNPSNLNSLVRDPIVSSSCIRNLRH